MTSRSGARWLWPAIVFVVVLAAQLGLVKLAGTDVPFQDQWSAEGQWLYPAWREGALRVSDLFRAHNEHRIVWTHALDIALFSINGQWDPLVQLGANAFLRAAAAAVLLGGLLTGLEGLWRGAVSVGVAIAFLPQLAWHNALWGFQSQVYFALLFSVLALRWLTARESTWVTEVAGTIAAVAALFAMAAGAFVPAALLGVGMVRVAERRRFEPADGRRLVIAAFLVILALLLRVRVPSHAVLQAHSVGEYVRTLGRVLAWPHGGVPAAAVVLNAPVVALLALRLARRRIAVPGEDFVLALACWGIVDALATAWARGGSAEFAAGVPSRYVDFVVLLPIANAWCVLALLKSFAARRRALAWTMAGAWAVFLAVGWAGLSAEMMRGVILPRIHDRDAPVRLLVAYQGSGDANVFAGQPRLLVPDVNLASVAAVMRDPRLRGALPPSLQPAQPMGPLSRAVRAVLRY